MQRNYWERIAPEYDDEIFDVLKNDQKKRIQKALQSVAGKNQQVVDIGCAVGKWLPFLSAHFKTVDALDISSRNLAIAQKRHMDLTNVSYFRADMSKPGFKRGAYDVALCVNAVLSSSLKKRQVFFDNIRRCLRANGSLILVVPSLESWLLTRIIQHQWKVDANLFRRAPADVAAKRYQDMLQGNAEIDEVATKHYLKEELHLLMQQNGFVVKAVKKIEYDWTTEFVHPPDWLQQPAPWDWMVHAERQRD